MFARTADVSSPVNVKPLLERETTWYVAAESGAIITNLAPHQKTANSVDIEDCLALLQPVVNAPVGVAVTLLEACDAVPVVVPKTGMPVTVSDVHVVPLVVDLTFNAVADVKQ